MAKNDNIPANAKKPQDHLTSKKEANGEDTVVEYNGVEYTIAANALNNVELAEYMEEEKFFAAVKLVLGKDQWTAWKDSVRDDEGIVSVEDFQNFIEVVFGNTGN